MINDKQLFAIKTICLKCCDDLATKHKNQVHHKIQKGTPIAPMLDMNFTLWGGTPTIFDILRQIKAHLLDPFYSGVFPQRLYIHTYIALHYITLLIYIHALIKHIHASITYIHTYIHTRIAAYIHKYIHTLQNINIYINIHIYITLHTYILWCVCMYVRMYASIYVSMYVCTYVGMYACRYVCMYACMDGWMYACIFFCVSFLAFMVVSHFGWWTKLAACAACWFGHKCVEEFCWLQRFHPWVGPELCSSSTWLDLLCATVCGSCDPSRIHQGSILGSSTWTSPALQSFLKLHAAKCGHCSQCRPGSWFAAQNYVHATPGMFHQEGSWGGRLCSAL